MTTRHNLPARPYQRLIGRETELAEIKSRLAARSRDWIIAIEGIGGLGKTALALEAGWRCVEEYARLPAAERFEAVVWATAKREMLTSRGIVPDSPTLTNLDDLFVALAGMLELPHLARSSRKERWQATWRALENAPRVLLIVDNLEDVDDSDLLVFLRDLPKGHKVIVTLRFHEDMSDPIELAPLDEQARRELVRMEFDAHRLALNPEQLKSISEETQGLPLAARLVVGLGEELTPDQALVRLRDKHGDLPRYLFGGIVDSLCKTDTTAYHALLACSFFDPGGDISIEGLAAAIAVDAKRSRRALDHLRRLNLLACPEDGHYLLPPIIHDYVAARRVAHADWERAARGKWVSFYERVAACLDRSSGYRGQRSEASHLRTAMQWLMRQEPGPESVRRLAALYVKAQDLLFAEGHWDAISDAADVLARSASKDALGTETVIALLQTPIDIFRRRSEHERGTTWLRQFEPAVASSHDPLIQAELLLARARLLCNDGTLAVSQKMPVLQALARQLAQRAAEAERAVEEALRIFEDAGRVDKVIQVYLTRGNLGRVRAVLPDIGHQAAWSAMERAKQDYERALALLRRELATGNEKLRPWQAVVQGNLALVTGRLGHHKQACADLRMVLPELIEQSDRAEALAALALYEYWSGRRDAAHDARQKADRLKKRLGLAPEQFLCHEDLKWADRDDH